MLLEVSLLLIQTELNCGIMVSIFSTWSPKHNTVLIQSSLIASSKPKFNISCFGLQQYLLECAL